MRRFSYLFRPGLARRVSLTFSLLSAVLLSVSGMFFYGFFWSKAESSLQDSFGQVMQINAQSVDQVFTRINTTIELIQSDQAGIAELLGDYHEDVAEGQKHFLSLSHQLENELTIAMDSVTSNYGAALYVDSDMPLAKLLPEVYTDGFMNDNLYCEVKIGTGKRTESASWYQRTLLQPNVPYWFRLADDAQHIFCAVALRQLTVQGSVSQAKSLGVLLLRMDASWILSSIDTAKLAKSTQVFLTDEQGNTLYAHPDTEQTLEAAYSLDATALQQACGGEAIRDGNQIIKPFALSSGLYLITIYQLADVQQMLFGISRVVLWMVLLSVMVGCVMVPLFSRRITKPILRLARHMENNDGMMPIFCSCPPEDEVSILYSSFNRLMKRMQELLDQTAEAAQREKNAEIQMLQMQINPHFVYNTLDTVCCITLMRGENDITEALSSLAAILRYNIKDPEQMVSFESERAIIDKYIKIEQLRIGIALKVQYDLEIDESAIQLPKMIIQPLVENCLVHGISASTTVLEILISGYGEGNDIILEVMGSAETGSAEAINGYLDGDEPLRHTSGGIGIRNIQKRLRTRFGAGYGLRYEQQGGNVIAQVRIPRTGPRSAT